jgi:hypothetical protein
MVDLRSVAMEKGRFELRRMTTAVEWGKVFTPLPPFI